MVYHQKENSKSNYHYNSFVYFNIDYYRHFHAGYELIYVLSGKIILTVNNRVECVSEGACALILPNQIHTITTDGHSQVWIGVFSQQYVPHFAKKIKDVEGNTSVFVCDEATDAFLREKLIFSEGSTMLRKACFYAVCDQYIKNVEFEKRNIKSDEIICDMLAYVEEHFKEDVTLSKLAAQFGYEYHYLSRLLNDKYRINFSDTVNRYRVEYAVTLLENTDKSVTDIALECGFQSIRSFNYTFKKIMGVSPSELAGNKK